MSMYYSICYLLFNKLICLELLLIVREEIKSLLEDEDDNLKNISPFNPNKEGKITDLITDNYG